LIGDNLLSFWQAKLVKQEQQAIDAQFEKKRKGAETAQKMCASLLFNPANIHFDKEIEHHSVR
jgi:V-type H+-transporting ATPase subunit E